ncbi:MAG: DUF1566 domain-containing protein [Desulfococcaceae bacterium]
MDKTDIRDCYEIIGVEPGVSPDQLKQAYRDLVSVWHPDRFANNPRLREKAEEQLKRINIAYQNIRRLSLYENGSWQSKTQPDGSGEKPENGDSVYGQTEYEDHMPEKEKKRQIFPEPWEWLKKWKTVLLTVFFGSLLLFFTVLFFFAIRLSPHELEKLEKQNHPSSTSTVKVQAPQMQTEENETPDSAEADYTWLEDLKQRIAWEKEERKKREEQEKIRETEDVKAPEDSVPLSETIDPVIPKEGGFPRTGKKEQEKIREVKDVKVNPEDKVQLFEIIDKILPKEKFPARNSGPDTGTRSASERNIRQDMNHSRDYLARIPPAESRNTPQEKNREERIRQYRNYIRQHLLQSGSRFVSGTDGTVTDTRTGLMWCILNSYQETGNYLDYGSAVRYAKTLQTGGYRNWRLPTSSELAEIYMVDPVFPDTGGKWYWTCETYIKGWNRTARIVRPGKHKRISDEYANLHERGMVHAVRHP